MKIWQRRINPSFIGADLIASEIRSGVAIVPVEGVLAYRPDPFEMLFYGIEDSAAVLDTFEQAAANSEVEGVMGQFGKQTFLSVKFIF